MDIRGDERGGRLGPTFLRDAIRATILLLKLLKVCILLKLVPELN